MAKTPYKKSYTDQKNHAARRRIGILVVLLFFSVCFFMTNFLFSMNVLENSSMIPSLNPGDRFIFSSYGITEVLPELSSFKMPSVERGNIVLVDKAPPVRNGLIITILNELIRFFTIGKARFPGRKELLYIKRVIALPGDTISMTNYILKVQPDGELYSFTEFELSDSQYNVNIPQGNALWDDSIPFSGNMETIKLGADEYFVLSDDRGNTNDSRTWGPVPLAFISGKLLIRYWPLSKIGFCN
jgi:signal peptidase I